MIIVRKYCKIFILILSLALCCGCSSKTYSSYKYNEVDIKTLFFENADMFTEVAINISDSDEFFEKARRDYESGHAWIMSPYDEKMQWFDSETKNMVNTFFHNYKPYMISLDYQRYITITFLNSLGNSGYTFVYYYDFISENANGRTYFEDWEKAQISNYDVFEELTDNWFFYYNE